MKHKVISRSIAYHGTTQGALSITGLPPLKQQFEPLVPSTFRVPNTNIYRAAESTGGSRRHDPEAFGRWAADQIAVAIENEGPDTVAAVFLEPVQNAGGCFPPPPGYFQRVREICDEYDVLLVSDEVICAFGRLGHMFGAERYGYQPDIITCAKGITSGYAPLGAMIASDRLMEPFLAGRRESFAHGYTFGGHPVSTAVAMAQPRHLRAASSSSSTSATTRAPSAPPSSGCSTCRSSATSAATATSTASSWSRTRRTQETFNDEESERLLRGFLSKALYDEGLYCRADDRGDPVIQLSPPLICDQTALRRDGADPARRPRQGRHACSDEPRAASHGCAPTGARRLSSVTVRPRGIR